MSDCPLDICTGTGLLPVTDFTGDDALVCACRAGFEPMPPEVADRLALVVYGEAKARRQAQELSATCTCAADWMTSGDTDPYDAQDYDEHAPDCAKSSTASGGIIR